MRNGRVARKTLFLFHTDQAVTAGMSEALVRVFFAPGPSRTSEDDGGNSLSNSSCEVTAGMSEALLRVSLVGYWVDLDAYRQR